MYFRLAPFASLNQNGKIDPVPILWGAIERVSSIKIGPPRHPQARTSVAELDYSWSILEGLVRGDELAQQQS
jgi:hypothetical protein